MNGRVLAVGVLVTSALAFGQDVVGEYEAVFEDHVEPLELSAEGEVRSPTGQGRWALSGRTLTLSWAGRPSAELDQVAPGRLLSRDTRFSLTRRQPIDLNGVVGLFEARHPRWRGVVTVTSDGAFWATTGEGGRWGFDGARLTLGWERSAPEVLQVAAGGRFVSADGRFVLSRKRTAVAPAPQPGPPVPLPAPGPVPAPPPPPRPGVDDSQVIGLFDVFNDQFADTVTFFPNRTFQQGNGNAGTWSFDGRSLEVTFRQGGRQVLVLEVPGRFAGEGRWFLVRRNAPVAPAPAPTLVTQPATPYAPVKVAGESCPTGMAHATVEEARGKKQQLCGLLDRWDIARLAGGGSMDGSGYGCGERPNDSRQLGHSLCRPVVLVPGPPVPAGPRPFVPYKREGSTCDDGVPLTWDEAVANTAALCRLLGKWDIARVGAGSLDGPGYNCKLRPSDDRKLGHILCRRP